MMEHTPEPWVQTHHTVRGEKHPILETMLRRGYFFDSPIHEELAQEDEANARRIVACVNACAGLSTEDLENSSHRILSFNAGRIPHE